MALQLFTPLLLFSMLQHADARPTCPLSVLQTPLCLWPLSLALETWSAKTVPVCLHACA